jgi:hypothetical protein
MQMMDILYDIGLLVWKCMVDFRVRFMLTRALLKFMPAEYLDWLSRVPRVRWEEGLNGHGLREMGHAERIPRRMEALDVLGMLLQRVKFELVWFLIESAASLVSRWLLSGCGK